MKTTYFLGLDVAKHKIRLALSDAKEQLLLEKDLPVNTAGLRELLAKLKQRVAKPEQLLVLLEATGVLHLNWSPAPSKAS